MLNQVGHQRSEPAGRTRLGYQLGYQLELGGLVDYFEQNYALEVPTLKEDEISADQEEADVELSY